MEKLREVTYQFALIPESMQYESKDAAESAKIRNGLYHGQVNGIYRGRDTEIPYTYGLVEDSETGKFYKIELENITFTVYDDSHNNV
jgi:hypothetical protein